DFSRTGIGTGRRNNGATLDLHTGMGEGCAVAAASINQNITSHRSDGGPCAADLHAKVSLVAASANAVQADGSRTTCCRSRLNDSTAAEADAIIAKPRVAATALQQNLPFAVRCHRGGIHRHSRKIAGGRNWLPIGDKFQV